MATFKRGLVCVAHRKSIPFRRIQYDSRRVSLMHLRPSIPSSMFDSRGSIHALWNSMWMALNWLLWSLTLAAAVVLMARRLMGALTGPLSGLSLFFASTTVTLLALVTYRVLTIGSPSAQILIGLGSSAALLLFGAAWSLPATPMAALAGSLCEPHVSSVG